MKRTILNSDQGNLKEFIKLGTGSLRYQGKIIKPGQHFMADPKLLPSAFMDVIQPVEKGVPPQREEAPKSKFTAVSHSSGGWYDVVDENGKVVNEKALRHQAALDLIKSLE